MSAKMNPEFMTQIQSPVLPVLMLKTEPPTVIKNEPPSDEESDSDIKDIDIVSHIIYEDSIKCETVSNNILESKHSESVETQIIVKAEKAPFVKIENIIPSENLNKTENTKNGNVCEGAGQNVVEVQDSNEDFNCYRTYKTTLWEEEKEKVKVIKAPRIPVEQHEYTSVAKEKHVCNHCQNVFNKLDYVKIHIKQMHREVTTMYQCPYCPFKSKWSIRYHIIQKHKDIKDIQKFEYHCNKCNCKTYSHQTMKRHKLTHLKPEEIQYYYCYHCSYKTMRKGNLITHFSRHFKNEQIKRGKRYHCDKCDYYTYTNQNLKSHKLIHLKPEETEYFYCYHCSYKSNGKNKLKPHIFMHFKNEEVTFHCYICDFMTLKRDLIIEHFKKHSKHYSKYDETQYKYLLETHTRKREKRYLCDKCDYKTYGPSLLNRHKIVHLKPEEIQYFYCYHCSHKSKQKSDLKVHISTHFKNEHVPFHCYICDFMTLKRNLIIVHIKNHAKLKLHKISRKTETKKYYCDKCDYNTFRRDQRDWHKLIHLKPKEIQYFYCYHCSHKSKRKDNLKPHIFNHFKNEEVTFHCYICDFMTPKRDLIAKHIQKHSKVPIKSEIKDEN